MTKAELIAALEHMSPLAEAIAAKNSEIAAGNEKFNKLTDELQQVKDRLNKQSHLAQAVEAKDTEIEKLKSFIKANEIKFAEQVSQIKKSYQEQTVAKDVELEELRHLIPEMEKIGKLQDSVQNLQEENKRIISTANLYVNAFRNLMRALQGTLDNSIEYEALITQTVQSQNKNKKGGNE